MPKDKPSIAPMSSWQSIFNQSKVNGADYRGESLPHTPWNWPKDTYLQRKLRNERIEDASNQSETR